MRHAFAEAAARSDDDCYDPPSTNFSPSQLLSIGSENAFRIVIGAQCTGKTTLVEALKVWSEHNTTGFSVATIQEIARKTLQLHGFTRDDVQ